MEVDGSRLLGRADEDSVFFLVRDLLAAVERLSTGDSTARVSFYESPYELMLQRVGDAVFITFYRGGYNPEVVVKDQVVAFATFCKGVKASALHLIEQARVLDPEVLSDPLVAWMNQAAARIKPPRGARPSETRVGAPVKVESTRWHRPRSDTGFSFGFRFLAGATDLMAPAGPLGNDLNSLLFRGQYVVHARGRRRVLGEGFLFLQTEKLLASVRKLLSAWEDGRPLTVRLISEGMVVGLRLGSDDSLVVTLLNQADEGSIMVLNDLSPWEYADAVLGAAREVRRLILDQAPRQRRNLRLESFAREIRTLATWAKEQRLGALINRDVDQYRRATERRRSEPVGTREINEASRLTFKERWRIEAEGLDLAGTVLGDGIALVSARGFMLGVDTRTGSVLWKRETDRAQARMQLAGRDGAVRVSPSGEVDMLEIHTGALKWRASLAARSGGSPVLLVVDHGPVPGVVIVAEEERKLVALDLRTGEPRWRHTVARGGRFAMRRNGRLLYVASSDSQLLAVDVEDGSLVWRFPGRTRFALPPALDGDTLLVPGGRFGKREGRLFGLDAFSGERRWERALDGWALTSPIVSGGFALIPVRTTEGSALAAFDVAKGEIAWRLACDGWAESCALMALDESFIINAAGGVLSCVEAGTGRDRWRTVLGPACSDDVPLNLCITLRGGVLFVPSDTVYVVRPQDGHVIHSLGGDPPVPDLMQVDASCAVFVAEESGHLGMYELTRRLSVLDGGAGG